jgi:hypothetical protein
MWKLAITKIATAPWSAVAPTMHTTPLIAITTTARIITTTTTGRTAPITTTGMAKARMAV